MRGECEGLLRFGGRSTTLPVQHDAVADALDVDVGVRQRLLERRAHAVEVARHRDVEGRRSGLPSASKKKTLVWPTVTPMM